MTRLPGLPVNSLGGDAKKLLDAITGGKRGAGKPLSAFLGPDGTLQGPWDPLLRTPEIGDRVQALGEAVRFTSILPDQLSELAILVCARHWRANYEWYAHAKIARAAGLPEPVIEAVMVKSTPPAGAGPEGVGAIYAYARALNENGEVGDGEFTAAMDLLGERGIVELTILVGYYGLISKLLNTFEKPVPAGEVTPFPR